MRAINAIVTPAKALPYARICRLHHHPASFDKLRMRGSFDGTKKYLILSLSKDVQR
jgi:hypothetical protein